MSDQKYAAIPTVYKGVQLRSRLEARWAAFFELLGLSWRYEPFDLDGYTPDFVVDDRAGYRPLIVEVKPAMTPRECISLGGKFLFAVQRPPAVIVGIDPTVVVAIDEIGSVVGLDHASVIWEEANPVIDGSCADGLGWYAESWAEAGNLTQYKSPRKR